jgi:hypothetical protein
MNVTKNDVNLLLKVFDMPPFKVLKVQNKVINSCMNYTLKSDYRKLFIEKILMLLIELHMYSKCYSC